MGRDPAAIAEYDHSNDHVSLASILGRGTAAIGVPREVARWAWFSCSELAEMASPFARLVNQVMQAGCQGQVRQRVWRDEAGVGGVAGRAGQCIVRGGAGEDADLIDAPGRPGHGIEMNEVGRNLVEIVSGEAGFLQQFPTGGIDWIFARFQMSARCAPQARVASRGALNEKNVPAAKQQDAGRGDSAMPGDCLGLRALRCRFVRCGWHVMPSQCVLAAGGKVVRLAMLAVCGACGR